MGIFYLLNFFSMNIFVAKLNYATESDDLRSAFEAYGTVSSAKVIMDKFTGKSRGFGFVEMDDESEALSAIQDLNDSELDGRTIVVKKAEPREDRGRDNNRW
jgi:RNA recognition motif-containing protein